ncbi:hypothetical protein, partial [Streptacidiphilus carbonis]|uniref:hypothetical protein n=1 Tax=Streptacidiphilus carbonis TaxID=105422 RepID=UPI001F3568EF
MKAEVRLVPVVGEDPVPVAGAPGVITGMAWVVVGSAALAGAEAAVAATAAAGTIGEAGAWGGAGGGG